MSVQHNVRIYQHQYNTKSETITSSGQMMLFKSFDMYMITIENDEMT